jgi:ribosomal protein L35AE/L33A
MAMRRSTRTRKIERMVLALLEQGTTRKAATALGMSEVTIWRWMKKPEFQAAYSQAGRVAFGQATARLHQASGAAVATVLKIMVDPTEPASTRLRAADSVLDHGAKGMELEARERRYPDRRGRGDRSEHSADQPQEVVVTVLPNCPLPPENPPRIIDVRAQR